MATFAHIKSKLRPVFDEDQTTTLAEVIDESQQGFVRTSDFDELKAIVKDLAIAQQRTEQSLDRLSVRMDELAAAQQRTDQRMDELAAAQQRTEQRLEELAAAQQRTEQRLEELAAAQQRTEQRVEELAAAQQQTNLRIDHLSVRVDDLTDQVKDLSQGLKETRRELGGLSHSIGYALENEAYRMLPSLLERHGIVLSTRLIREEVGGKEINLLGYGERQGQPIVLVGEVKLRLDEQRKQKGKTVFDELEERVQVVQAEVRDRAVVPLLVTHYATKTFLREARERDILIFQSYEW